MDWQRAIIMSFDHHADPQLFNCYIPFGRADFSAWPASPFSF